MATAQLTVSSISTRNLASFQGLRPTEAAKFGPSVGHLTVGRGLSQRSFKGLVVKAATVVAPKVLNFETISAFLLISTGNQVVYSQYAGTELEFNGSKHLILKDDNIVGILETDDVKDLKPLNDRVLIKVAEAEEKTAGGLLLTEASKERPSIGTVVAVGPGTFDEEGNRKPLTLTPGNTVMYSKYAGNDFKGKDGLDYITLRASDVIAVLS
ncbi:hypothetical protein F2P56_022715 [Juglans regia]|uniref:20 kDa chaperonin, chloroplastic n=1 Tax=Juglans regia TaxID=51240 RepID=A0A833U8K0_JUGRE|nr:hypothetical protein F2P56_022715 [Juglans regia]